MPTVKEIAWFAGLLDGEGWFVIKRQKGAQTGSFVVGICMTDFDVIQKAVTVSGGVLHGPYRNNGFGMKPVWRCVLYGALAASWAMTVFPLMGKRRQQQIRAGLEVWKMSRTRRSRTTPSLDGRYAA